MNELTDIATRLRSANPIRIDTFDSARVSPMVDRVVAARSMRHLTVLHTWKAKALAGATAVAAASALAFSLIGTSSPAPSLALPKLALESRIVSIGSGGSPTRLGGGPAMPVNLAVGSDLAQAPTPSGLPTVQLIEPPDPISTTLAIAKVFGVSGSVLNTPAGGLAVVDPSTGRIDAGIGVGFYQWGFGRNPADGNCANYPPASPTYPSTCVPITTPETIPPTTGPLPSDASAASDAMRIAKATAPDLTYGTPVVTDSQDQVAVAVPIVVGGAATGQSVTVNYGPGGVIENAMGEVGTLGSAVNYPLSGPYDAAKSLAVAHNAATDDPSARTVILDDVSSNLTMQHSRNGATWFLPTYLFSSSTNAANQFGIVAINPSYLQVSGSSGT